MLAGKTASAEVAEELLLRGKLLDPDTCSWHYVEGLHKSDNPKLALFWDKIGLGHNGERKSEGGHSVCLLGGDRIWVFEEEWPAFLEEQAHPLTQPIGHHTKSVATAIVCMTIAAPRTHDLAVIAVFLMMHRV